VANETLVVGLCVTRLAPHDRERTLFELRSHFDKWKVPVLARDAMCEHVISLAGQALLESGSDGQKRRFCPSLSEVTRVVLSQLHHETLPAESRHESVWAHLRRAARRYRLPVIACLVVVLCMIITLSGLLCVSRGPQ